ILLGSPEDSRHLNTAVEVLVFGPPTRGPFFLAMAVESIESHFFNDNMDLRFERHTLTKNPAISNLFIDAWSRLPAAITDIRLPYNYQTLERYTKVVTIGQTVIQQGYRVLYREAHKLLEDLAEATLDGTRKETDGTIFLGAAAHHRCSWHA